MKSLVALGLFVGLISAQSADVDSTDYGREGRNRGLGRLREHDPSKCLEKGNLDKDCCAREGKASCKDGYTLTLGKACPWW